MTHELAPGVFGTPRTSEDAVDNAWQRLRSLALQARDTPSLRDNPEHIAKREAAAVEFQRLFAEWSQ